MAKEYMKRIEALRQQYLQTRVDMDVYDAAFFTEGFKEMEGSPGSSSAPTATTMYAPRKTSISSLMNCWSEVLALNLAAAS